MIRRGISAQKISPPPPRVCHVSRLRLIFVCNRVRTAIFLFRIGVGGETCAVAEPTTGRSVESAREDKARARGETIADD